jgi:hypothetical protein
MLVYVLLFLLVPAIAFSQQLTGQEPPSMQDAINRYITCQAQNVNNHNLQLQEFQRLLQQKEVLISQLQEELKQLKSKGGRSETK